MASSSEQKWAKTRPNGDKFRKGAVMAARYACPAW
jgi:hypothetical protein